MDWNLALLGDPKMEILSWKWHHGNEFDHVDFSSVHWYQLVIWCGFLDPENKHTKKLNFCSKGILYFQVNKSTLVYIFIFISNFFHGFYHQITKICTKKIVKVCWHSGKTVHISFWFDEFLKIQFKCREAEKFFRHKIRESLFTFYQSSAIWRIFWPKYFKSSKQCEIRILNFFGQKIREILFTFLQCNLTNFLTEIFQNFKALRN